MPQIKLNCNFRFKWRSSCRHANSSSSCKTYHFILLTFRDQNNIPMKHVHIFSGILAIVVLWMETTCANQVATSEINTCVLSGTNVTCWGGGMFAFEP